MQMTPADLTVKLMQAVAESEGKNVPGIGGNGPVPDRQYILRLATDCALIAAKLTPA